MPDRDVFKSPVHELARRIERLPLDDLMTLAVELVNRNELQIAEMILDRAVQLIRLRRAALGV